MALTPAARADQWQKSSDGYWYYWSDADQRWYYLDGKEWFIEKHGTWVKWTPPLRRPSSYYYGHSPYYYPPSGGSVRFPYGSVSWGAGGQVTFPYGSVSWGPGGGHVAFPFGNISWPGRGWRH